MNHFVPPAAVRKNAADGLHLVHEGFAGRGLTQGAYRRALQLAHGVPINAARARMMRAWFARHTVDKRPRWAQRKTPGWVAWQLWGGDAARRWVEGICARVMRATS